MTKQEWILQQYNLSPEKNIPLFTSLLNTKALVPNPVPQPTVPKAFTIEQAFAVVPDAEAFAISETRTYERLLDAFNQGRMDWVQDNIKTLIAGGKLTLPTAQAIGALMAQTKLDPSWQAQIMASPAELAGFGMVYVNEVEESIK